MLYSPGGIGGHNHQSPTGLAGDSHYVIIQGNVSLLAKLPLGFTAITRAEGHVASDTLAGSELFAVGGATTVRGYDTSEAVGEEGYLFSTELRSPSFKPLFSLSKMMGKPMRVQDNIQLLLFMDYSGVRSKSPTAPAPDDTNLWSIGPGIRYNMGRYASLKFDYGFQLKDSTGDINITLRNRRNRRAHMAVEISY